MSPLLRNVYGSDGGSEALDVLMKYMYVVYSRRLAFDLLLSDRLC